MWRQCDGRDTIVNKIEIQDYVQLGGKSYPTEITPD